jgi:predicted dienelactone hydrolase
MSFGIGSLVHGQDGEVWQGSFDMNGVTGAMELVFVKNGDDIVQARFTPRGNFETPAVSNKEISKNRIIFIATVAGARYRFAGKKERNLWAGTVEDTERKTSQGKWKLTRLLPPAVSEVFLPPPTGKFAVGRTQFHWVDENRAELETRDPNDRRELMVYLFYPAVTHSSAQTALYLPDAEALRPELKEDQIAKLRAVKTHSGQDSPMARKQKPYPVLIVAPGAGTKVLSYTAVMEDIASHGYIVAAIDPPYTAPAVKFPNGKVLRTLSPGERGWETATSREDFQRIYEQMIAYWCKDFGFVLTKLKDMNTKDGRFAGSMDLVRVGAFGHSQGGHLVGKLRLLDPRFSAALNLDGNFGGQPFPTAKSDEGGATSFLWLERQYPWPLPERLQRMKMTEEDFKKTWVKGDEIMGSIKAGATRVTIARPSIGHQDFSDASILDPNISPVERGGKLRTLAIERLVLQWFFDSTLKGKKGRDLSKLLRDYPEVETKQFPPHSALTILNKP